MNQPYSFRVKPVLATAYSIRVITGRAQVAKSSGVNVYVSSGGTISPTTARSCNTPGNRPICHQKFDINDFLPAAVARFEAGKHLYSYLGLNLAPSKPPAAPKFETLRVGWTISARKLINGTDFRFSVAFAFRVNNDAYSFVWTMCTPDTEARDGFGLPGHHQCGDQRIPTSAPYLG